MITSTTNGTVKHILALQKKHSLRSEEGVFIVEGLRMFREIPAERIVCAFVTEEAYKTPEVYNCLKGVRSELVSEQVMKAMSETVTSQGMMAVVKQLDCRIVPKKGRTYLLLDRLSDPGNLGTIIRMAEASDVAGVILSSDCVDIYNPKVVRSTMGAILRVPFEYVESLTDYIEKLKSAGIKVYGASLENSTDYAKLDYTDGCAFVIGNEANGMSGAVSAACSENIHIPMTGSVESLNASIAASVLAFEAYRQRRL
ncbi:MAG: RNA methyltransferase [Lachnospiraceae bacterium]|nr:RNA methyltransferase [Lachnospiraceae bacterium]